MTGELSRRQLLALGAAAGGLSLTGCGLLRSAKRPVTETSRPLGPIDYSKARPTPTVCFGCTTHCGVVGWVQDGRVRRLSGNPLDTNTGGRICSKANGQVAVTYYPERVLYPLERVGPRGSGRWRRISWDEAITKIGDRMKALREAGTPERFVFHYGRDKTKGYTKHFTNAFGTPHRLNRRSICSSNRRVPLMSYYGRDFEWETQDLEHTKYVLNFGGNPMEAYQGGLFMAWRLMDSKVDRGAKLVTFEVRPSATASVSDEYIAVRPGTDGAVALAMAHVICREELYDEAFWNRWANYPLDAMKRQLERFSPAWAERESGVPAATITRLAREFAAAAPAATTMSNRGSAKHYNGAQSDRAIRLLDVLCGTVGKPGGFCLSTLRGWSGKYGQDGLPHIGVPDPKPPKPKPWKPGTREFESLPAEVRRRVAAFPEAWQNKYYGELATPSEYPLSWHWYPMRVGQLVYEYIRQGRQKVDVYMSFTLGAAYGYPEAKAAREVLLDEDLIPFHVAIDIGYSEHAALADIILPDATSLERWDAHGTNNYGLRPYIGLRQPLVEPLGQARSVQDILRDLAHHIGGGMERYFDFDDVEDFYRRWHANLPMAWEEFKRRGIWTDLERPLDYELYERPVAEADLDGSEIDEATGLIRGRDGKTIGIVQDGKAVQGFPTPDRKIGVHDPVFPLAARHVGLPEDDPLASPVATWFEVPAFAAMDRGEQLHFTTFKWNVHTQGRSGHWKHSAEIIHDNPLFIAPRTARARGLADGDLVEVTVSRPEGHGFRAGEEAPVGSFRQRIKVLPGMSENLVAASHHVGHWQHGPVARAEPGTTAGAKPGFAPRLSDPDIANNMWWSESRGGVGNGVHINDAMPIDPAPLVGGQNWFDNVCNIRKV